MHTVQAARATDLSQGSTPTIEVSKDFQQNTAPDNVDAAAQRLVAKNAAYVPLSFNNPELIEDFSVTDMFGTGPDIAIIGSFTCRSTAVGTSFRSPFAMKTERSSISSSWKTPVPLPARSARVAPGRPKPIPPSPPIR